jgi:hypothetical protein
MLQPPHVIIALYLFLNIKLLQLLFGLLDLIRNWEGQVWGKPPSTLTFIPNFTKAGLMVQELKENAKSVCP